MDIISENGLSKGRKPRPHGWSRRGKGWGREGWREDWREERGEPCRDFLGHRGFKLLNQFIAVFEWGGGFVWIRTSGRYIRVFLHHHTGLWRKRSYHSVTSDWPLKRPVRLGVLVWPGCNCETFGGVVHSPIYICICIYIYTYVNHWLMNPWQGIPSSTLHGGRQGQIRTGSLGIFTPMWYRFWDKHIIKMTMTETDWTSKTARFIGIIG